MSHPLEAKRSQKFTQAVWKRDHGRCQLCGLDCSEFEQLLGVWQAKYYYEEIRQILKEHKLPAPRLGYKCWQVDHVVPIARGGQTVLSNLRLLCLDCHKAVTADLKKQLVKLPEKIRHQEISLGGRINGEF